MATRQQPADRRIAVGVDGSPPSRQALRWAVRQAALTGSAVDAVIAWHDPASHAGYAWLIAGNELSDRDTIVADLERCDVLAAAERADLESLAGLLTPSRRLLGRFCSGAVGAGAHFRKERSDVQRH